jgi:hypothetical protein
VNSRIDSSVISDVSANIFAVFILILVILLANARPPPPAQSAPSSIDATRDLHAVERAPVRAGDMVEMLRGHAGSGVINIDLFDGRIEIAGAAGAAPLVLDVRRDGGRAMLDRLDGILRGEGGSTPVRLFVFSNRRYAAVTGRLAAAGRPWQEVSVPQALRATVGGRTGDAWSNAFLDLVSRNLDRDRFRAALSRLLAGSGDSADQLRRSSGAPPAGTAGAPETLADAPAAAPAAPADAAPASAAASGGGPELSLLDRIKRFLGFLVAVTAMIAAFGAIALVERRHPRSIRL